MAYKEILASIDAADARLFRKLWAKMRITLAFAAGWVFGVVRTLFSKRR